MKIREHGLQQRERGRVYPGRPKCEGGQNFGSVRWQDCSAAVMILVCGLIISIVTFSVESLTNLLIKARAKKNGKLFWCGEYQHKQGTPESIQEECAEDEFDC